MNLVNAISKARFSSAKAQRVQLDKSDRAVADLLCLEPGQEVEVSSGRWVYYVIAGTASVIGGGEETEVPTGQLAATAADEAHRMRNSGERRLVCLAVGWTS